MASFASRDYGALWDMLSTDSHRDTERVLVHVRRDPKYRETMRLKFGIDPDVLARMTPRDFFIALMSGVDRSAPQVVKLRAEAASSAVFSHEKVDGDRAVVYWDSAHNGREQLAFVLESGRWKPVMKR